MRLALLCALALPIALALLGGCARDVRATFPAPPGAPTGTLVLLLSEAASGVSVALDGRLVVHGAHTARVEVTGVPVGTVEVVMTANGVDKGLRVWIDGERPTTVPLGAPDPMPGIWRTLLGAVVSVAAYRLINP